LIRCGVMVAVTFAETSGTRTCGITYTWHVVLHRVQLLLTVQFPHLRPVTGASDGRTAEVSLGVEKGCFVVRGTDADALDALKEDVAGLFHTEIKIHGCTNSLKRFQMPIT